MGARENIFNKRAPSDCCLCVDGWRGEAAVLIPTAICIILQILQTDPVSDELATARLHSATLADWGTRRHLTQLDDYQAISPQTCGGCSCVVRRFRSQGETKDCTFIETLV